MPFCGSCHTPVIGTDARFCSKCGQRLKLLPVVTPELWVRPEKFESICKTLVELLDQTRNRWLELVKEGIAEDLPDLPEVLVNKDFHESNRVFMSEEEMPSGYPYNTVTGETVEAAIIYWQTKYMEYFATKEHDYLRNVDRRHFWKVFTDLRLNKSSPRWLLSGAGSLAGAATDDNCIVELLAHYITGESSRTPKWAVICESIRKRISLFIFMTYTATAAAFGDEPTFHRLAQQIDS